MTCVGLPRASRRSPRRICSPPVVHDDGPVLPLSAERDAAAGPHLGGRATGGLQMSLEFSHEPVMVEEVVGLFAAVPPGVVVDATLGGGGHAAAILEARSDLELVGIDQDIQALGAARERLARFGGRVRCYRARFDDLEEVVEADRSRPGLGSAAGGQPVVGVLFDLGVSSYQLDAADRGFSYRLEGPLDMRMDPTSTTTAADLVNRLGERELIELLVAHGEDRLARRIARAVLGARPILTTGHLAEVVADAVPAAARRRGHPAKRVFQALRVAVNEELDVLPPALDSAIGLLSPGGRCVVLSYHSGEDRLVKGRFLHGATGGCTCPLGLPCVCGAQPSVRLLNRGARMPSQAEVEANPRAGSARLRAVQRLEDVPAGEGGTGEGEGGRR